MTSLRKQIIDRHARLLGYKLLMERNNRGVLRHQSKMLEDARYEMNKELAVFDEPPACPLR